ncbi:hypothetical protein GGF37_003685 [Kickxella alabastrina]|nr:hypothetical protein GGF37_003685 [Kickxella alabastrina]
MFAPASGTSTEITTRGSTLILPAVSIGNVPQLAVDLLINTLRMQRIGVFDSASLTPVSGPAGYDHLSPEIRSHPLEVYQTSNGEWTTLQQRSPPLPKHHRLFAREIMEYIKDGGFARVVVLASSDAALRTDALIDGSQIRTLAFNWDDDNLANRMQALSLSNLATGEGQSALAAPLDQIHAAGVTRPLLKLCEQAGVPTFAMVSLVNEGDNVPDAIMLANAANAALGVAAAGDIAHWLPPRSWECLMPTSVPSELF